jgi:Flp pilus assembly CpaF family ATPase
MADEGPLDRVVVGELVEDEALDMLDVASMCKRGSLATIHANREDIEDVIQLMSENIRISDNAYPPKLIHGEVF